MPRDASDDASSDGAHNGAIYRPETPPSAPTSSSASGPIYRPGNSTAAPTSGPTAAPTSGPAVGSAAAPGPAAAPASGSATAPTSGPAGVPTFGSATTPTSGPTAGPASGRAGAPAFGSAAAPTSGPASSPSSRSGSSPTSGPGAGPTTGSARGSTAAGPATGSAQGSTPAAPTTGSAHGSAHVPTQPGPHPTSALPAPAAPGHPGHVQTAGMHASASGTYSTQPHGAQPGQTQPGQTQPDQTQAGQAQPGQTQAGQTQADQTQPGMPPQPGPAQANPTAAGLAQPHPTPPGTAQPHPGAAPQHPNQPHPTHPQTAQPHPAPPGIPQPHPAPPGTPQPPGPYGYGQAPYVGAPTQQPIPGQRPPGPYPPTVDPRALPPHPQINQGADPTAPPGPSVDPFQDLPWVSDTPTAEEFARRRMAKQAEPTATMGARALLRKGTMGLVKLAPGRHEVEFKQDVEMVRRNFGGLRQVTVVNPKGGAGKTIAVLLLAMTFGQKRGGYVLAWDNNETQGTLGMRAQQDFHARTVRDMMRDLHLFRGAHGRVGDLSQYVRAQGEGMFDVLASDESATAGEMLTASAFAEIREIVSRFYKLIFVDTGNNVRAQNWQAAMDATDQLVITMSARNDSAETAARMLDHLEQSGRQRLVRQAVSIVSMPPTRKDIDLPAIQRHFAARTRAVLLAPYEKMIDSGEPLRYGQLSAGTKDAWLKIAAAVAEGL
ncbi:chromosome partitioning protein [Actinoplanes sp. NPDC051411]|uniref:MinD/ParA family ATP-binding protein n=1 Tax=Actinoplanes sp. NPDC051411 TaxID=3155522 RepID=UPI003414BA26